MATLKKLINKATILKATDMNDTKIFKIRISDTNILGQAIRLSRTIRHFMGFSLNKER